MPDLLFAVARNTYGSPLFDSQRQPFHNSHACTIEQGGAVCVCRYIHQSHDFEGSSLEEMADDPADAMQLRLKSKLMNAIIDHIDEAELT